MKHNERYRLRIARKLRVKNKVQKNKGRLRLSIFKTAKHIYAQIIDDTKRATLVSESTLSPTYSEAKKSCGNVAGAIWVGQMLGEKAIKQGIKEVYCDRNGFLYTGRVKALADAVREKGVKF
ncbi:MAG: 50S ribosomal protein L18 [Nitrospinae bacterium RIFCSPLOWO2_12_FULL_47_7]|nr:MAG: 50S ribosomal protein L18 [Nitrospinae bacterium RIFCSPLOWO2_12_FULL_47_7]